MTEQTAEKNTTRRPATLLPIIVVIFVIAVFVAMLGFGRWIGFGMMGPGMMGWMMGSGWLWGPTLLISLPFLILIILGIYYLAVGYKEETNSTRKTGDKSLEILKERYAKGELTAEQFQKMKEQLQS